MKKLLTRKNIAKLVNRYEKKVITLKVLYPVEGTKNVLNTVDVIHPDPKRGKELLRYDNREMKWQLYWPIIDSIPDRKGRQHMEYRFRKFRWKTLDYEIQHTINRQLDAMVEEIVLTLDYTQQDKYFNSLHLMTA